MRNENFSKFIKYYGKGRKIKLFCFFLLSLIAGGLEFLGISLVYPFILLIIKPETITVTKYYKNFAAFTHQPNILVNAFLLGILIMLVFIIKNLYMLLCSYLQNKFVTNWKLALNKKFMYYYIYAPYKISAEKSPSEKLYNLNFLINQTLDGFIFRIIHFVTNVVIVAMILWLLLSKFPSAAIITGIFIALCLWTYKKLFKEKMYNISTNFARYSVSSNDRTMEIINNLKELKILCAEDYFYKIYSSEQNEYNRILFENNFYSAIPPYIVEMFVVFALIVLAGIISIQNISNASGMIASYTIIAAALFRIAPALNRIQISLNAITASRGFVKAMINEYEKTDFGCTETRLGAEIELNEKIALKDINFAYKNKNIIEDLNLEIKKGEFVGIIGLSGAGKSTLADIIMGLLPIQSGEIYIDSIKITQDNFYSLRKIMGYVTSTNQHYRRFF